VEAALLLATIARRWRLHLVPGHPVELQPAVTLRPKHGMVMTLERRRA
jgi:cytochrome P450